MSTGGWRLGLDLGGTGCRAVAVGPDGELLARQTTPTPARLDRDAGVNFVRSFIDAMSQPGPPASIGIGASGPIDAEVVIRNPDTLPAVTGLPLAADLRERLRVPVAIENDAVTAAAAEQRVGSAAGIASFLHLTLGTGVGICVITPNGPFRAVDGTHPEASHFSVEAATPLCYCGRRSCFEQGASRTALQRSAAVHLALPVDDVAAISRLRGDARRGDDSAQTVFDQYGLVLADGMSTLISTCCR